MEGRADSHREVPGHVGGHRESALQTVGRRISQVFTRVVGNQSTSDQPTQSPSNYVNGRSDKEKGSEDRLSPAPASKRTRRSTNYGEGPSSISTGSVEINGDVSGASLRKRDFSIPTHPRRVNSLFRGPQRAPTQQRGTGSPSSNNHTTSSPRPQINWSLVQSRPGTRMPAHVIVEAYREALESRALQQKVSMQKQQREIARTRATSTAEDETIMTGGSDLIQKGMTGDGRKAESKAPHLPTLSGIPSRTGVPIVNGLNPKGTPIGALSKSNNRGGPPRSIKGGVSKVKAKDRTSRARIQLQSRPVVDVSALPADRKKLPNYFSANFDISDSDNDEIETEETTKATPTPILKRPQVESSKLKNTITLSEPVSALSGAVPVPESKVQDTPNDKTETPTEHHTPRFSFAANPSNVGDHSNDAKPVKSKNDQKPSFSFGKAVEKESTQPVSVAFGTRSDGSKSSSGGPFATAKSDFSGDNKEGSSNNTQSPTFTFGSKPSEVTPQSSDALKFSFGAQATDSKRSHTTSPPTSETNAAPKISFSSGNTEQSNAQSGVTFGATKSTTSPQPSQHKPTFSFGSKATTSSQPEKADAHPTISKSAESSLPLAGASKTAETRAPPFSFGSFGNPSQTSANKPDEKPQNPTTPATSTTFSFGAQVAEKADTPNPAPGFLFGSGASAPSFGAGITKPADSGLKTGFTFGAPKDATPATNGSSTNGTTTESNGTPAVKAPSNGAPSFGATGSSFNFGAPESGSSGSTASSMFGTTAPPAAKAPAISFGGISSQPGAQPSTQAASAMNFGTGSLSGVSMGSSNAAGNSGSMFGGTSKPSSFSFGAPSSSSAHTPGVAGTTVNLGANTTGSTGAFQFGAKLGAPAGSQSLFGANGTTNTPGSPNIIPNAHSAVTTAPTTAFSFGAPATSAPTGTTPFIFGAQANQAQPQTSASGAPGSFQFGAPNTPGSGFGGGFGAQTPGATGFGFGGNAGSMSSRESTPGVGGRKMAQVKRRLKK